ncbi:transposable element Tcb2 transposase [Trichonephila clavipes]|nr:transposable element Tcb2 transposase [Trichonephila clavipes]
MLFDSLFELNGQIQFHVFDRGSVTRDRYSKEMIRPHVRLFRDAIGQDLVFMDEDTRSHRTADIQLLLECEDITQMV